MTRDDYKALVGILPRLTDHPQYAELKRLHLSGTAALDQAAAAARDAADPAARLDLSR
jgi:hypothetical protein